MTKVSHERVLCFPRKLLEEMGSFQGFLEDDGTLVEHILSSGHVKFIERDKVEEDPSYKQLIPYVVIKWLDKFLHYVRGKNSDEIRLRHLGSIGVGGHISVTDHNLFGGDIYDVFTEGIRREVTEEIEVNTLYDQRILGFINDDSNPVGRVHFGVLAIWNLAEPNVIKRERPVTSLEFLTIKELRSRKNGLETWSQIVLDNCLDRQLQLDRYGRQLWFPFH